MVICSYHWAVTVSVLEAKTSNTCEKSFLHSNTTMLVCSKINLGVDKFHWEVVIKIHEYRLQVQDFDTSSFVFPCITMFQSMLNTVQCMHEMPRTGTFRSGRYGWFCSFTSTLDSIDDESHLRLRFCVEKSHVSGKHFALLCLKSPQVGFFFQIIPISSSIYYVWG